jgi:hypothetical protein
MTKDSNRSQNPSSPGTEDPIEDLEISQASAETGSQSSGQLSGKPGFEQPLSTLATSRQAGRAQGVLPPLPAAVIAGQQQSAAEDPIEDVPESVTAASEGSGSSRSGFEGPPNSPDLDNRPYARAVLPVIGTS